MIPVQSRASLPLCSGVTVKTDSEGIAVLESLSPLFKLIWLKHFGSLNHWTWACGSSSCSSTSFLKPGQSLDTESRCLMIVETISPFSPEFSTGCWTDMTTDYALD
ncbi:hypothetical protein EYF80_003037 [Liparis tanakae]|uniref:Uncharacterized protein n=1 Tax=Liparis tanakae TaxID=230148 RepID=A0A4Z2JAL9_9TELE|nr:hypothetical protein EYF80_003037 [Liparis tanakae]